jgi:hypothetical protein
MNKNEYMYMLTNMKDMIRIEKLNDKYKYLPFINENNIEDQQLINSLFLISIRKPIMEFYGFTIIKNILKKSNDSELNIFKKLIIANNIVEVDNLYFLEYEYIFKFKNILSKKILIKELNDCVVNYNLNKIKFPSQMSSFEIINSYSTVIINMILNLYSNKIKIFYKKLNIIEQFTNKQLFTPITIQLINNSIDIINLHNKKLRTNKTNNSDSDDEPNNKSNNSDSDDKISNSDSDDKISNSDSDDEISNSDSDDEISNSDSDDEISNSDSDDEISNIIFKFDNYNENEIIRTNIPILWIPCSLLKKEINKSNITIVNLEDHYRYCKSCEVINNNKIDIKLKKLVFSYKSTEDKNEMDSIIMYYKFVKNYTILKEEINKYDYILTKINMLYYKNENDIYNECIFII